MEAEINKYIEDVHVLFLHQHLDETFDGPISTHRYFNRLSPADRAFGTSFVLKGVGIHAISTNEHEIVVEVSS